MNHVPDTLLPGMDNQEDPSFKPTVMFLVGIAIGIVLGLSIYYALTK